MKSFFSTIGILVLTGMIVSSVALAADTAAVTATVTVQNVSVSVSDGSIEYGTITASATQDTTTNGVDDSQTATNNGNVTEDFNIIGVDSSAWELADTAASETYTHKSCTASCDGSPTWTAFNEDGYSTLATSVASLGTQDFDLQVGTPTATTDYTEQTVSVTIQAVAS